MRGSGRYGWFAEDGKGRGRDGGGVSEGERGQAGQEGLFCWMMEDEGG